MLKLNIQHTDLSANSLLQFSKCSERLIGIYSTEFISNQGVILSIIKPSIICQVVKEVLSHFLKKREKEEKKTL